MSKEIWCKISSVLMQRRWLLLLGLLLTIALTSVEVLKFTQKNYLIFAYSTLDFWKGISAYSAEWSKGYGLDYYLYLPLFNILFYPFAITPVYVGPYLWNIFNFLLYFAAIFTLPLLSEKQKCRSFLFSLLILAPGQMSFQYNIGVLALFLFAFTLLERNKPYWAILLIMISAYTKVYGLLELSLLLFYPRFWKNIAFAILLGILFFLIPLIQVDFVDLPSYYSSWMRHLTDHHNSRHWQTFFYIRSIFPTSPANYTVYQFVSFLFLALLILLNRAQWRDLAFRMQALGGLMFWMTLFSNSAETHTYLIAIWGFLIWMESRPHLSTFEQGMKWALFIFLIIVHIDLFCPPRVMHYLDDVLNVNLYIATFTLCWMIYKTLIEDHLLQKRQQPH